MQVITELLLGKADPGLREPELPFDIGRTAENAKLIESLGFDKADWEAIKAIQPAS